MSGDKRTVATDALAVLGTILADDSQKRDAIHIAVEPVIAGERMDPADHITVIDGVAFRADDGDENPPLGIVDPYLKAPVRKGQRFLFLMYPGLVHSLRHVWAHPAFPDTPDIPAPTVKASPDSLAALKTNSEAWLRDYIESQSELSYEEGMKRLVSGESISGRETIYDIPGELWVHAEIVLGHPIPRQDHFYCSC